MGSPSRDSVAAIRQMVAAQLPDQRVHPVVRVGEGADNLAYEVGGELIVRCSKEPDPAARAEHVDREARLLAAVASIAPLPVPEPSFTVPVQGCLAYRKLPGVPLLDLPQPLRSAHAGSVAARVGELLTALHAAPLEPMAALVDVDDRPLEAWRAEAAETHATVAGEVPAAYRRPVGAFLDASPPTGGWAPVFSHNDLGIEHVLVDPGTGTVTGVIDWSDAAIVDPAVDFGRLYRDLGPAAAHAAMASYRTGVDELVTLEERTVFYARCSLLEDLAYGLQTGRDRYVDKSLAALAWLFHPHASTPVMSRERTVEELLERVASWARRRHDIRGVALVGSSARGTARADSDVDLVVLTNRPDHYLDDEEWTAALGATRLLRTQAWGPLTERRLLLEGGLEVEVGIAEPSWAATDPVDPGTRRVVTDGLRILHDPEGRLAALAVAAATDRPSQGGDPRLIGK